MPPRLPAQPRALQDLSGDRTDVWHLGEDGREIHVAGVGHTASCGRGTNLSDVTESMKMDARSLEEAEAWFARLQADEHGNREGFERWLHALPAHAAAWDRTQALWQRMGTLVQD